MKLFFFFVFLFSVFLASAQPADVHFILPEGIGPRIFLNDRIKVIKGDPAELTALRTVKIKFDYSEMRVCNYSNLGDYISSKTKKKSEAEKDKVIKKWQDKMEQEFEVKFRRYFDKKVARVGISSADSAPVELRVKFMALEPHGSNYMGKPFAYVICYFLSSNESQNVAFELTAFGTRDNNDYDRVAECYAIAGKMIGDKLASYFNTISQATE